MPSLEIAPSFHTPNYLSALATAEKVLNERQMKGLKCVLDSENSQFIKNFTSFKSTVYPGVEFSTSSITLTKDTVKEAAQAMGGWDEILVKGVKDTKKQSKKIIYFTFSSMVGGKADNAAASEDMIIDRTIRSLAKISAAVKSGDTPPELTIHSLGNPVGLGGKVTRKWLSAIYARGLRPHSKLYKEYILKNLPEDLSNTQIILQGVSRGGTIAPLTFEALPVQVQEKTKVIMDNPIGIHQPKKLSSILRGARVAVGLLAESIARKKDPQIKIAKQYGKQFLEKLTEYSQITSDSKEQAELKKKVMRAEGLSLTFLGGAKIKSDENRYFMRIGLHDPLTYNPRNQIDAIIEQLKARVGTIRKSIDADYKPTNGMVIESDGRSMVGRFYGSHFFSPYRRFNRWAQVMDSIYTI